MNETEKTFTPVEVLDIVINKLFIVEVPIRYSESIGSPILESVNILNELKKAFVENANREQEVKEEIKEQVPELEVVQDG